MIFLLLDQSSASDFSTTSTLFINHFFKLKVKCALADTLFPTDARPARILINTGRSGRARKSGLFAIIEALLSSPTADFRASSPPSQEARIN
jgi:hypothetical protein